MNEQFSPSNFEKHELPGGGELLLPANAQEPGELWTPNNVSVTPTEHELRAQREVMGTDGHGSIRNEHPENPAVDPEAKQEKNFDDMLDPRNVIDLKAKLERQLAKKKEESQFSFDGRKDKDGSQHARDNEARDSLKEALIKSYTQTGAEEDSPRDIPETITGDISRMLDLSFDELEGRVNKLDHKDATERSIVELGKELEDIESGIKQNYDNLRQWSNYASNAYLTDEHRSNIQKLLNNGDRLFYDRLDKGAQRDKKAGVDAGADSEDDKAKFEIAARQYQDELRDKFFDGVELRTEQQRHSMAKRLIDGLGKLREIYDKDGKLTDEQIQYLYGHVDAISGINYDLEKVEGYDPNMPALVSEMMQNKGVRPDDDILLEPTGPEKGRHEGNIRERARKMLARAAARGSNPGANPSPPTTGPKKTPPTAT